ncbi:hypothetical protein ACH5RR_020414 [Cinchona calisaya]|uniref:Membrane protein of ER body-like protein n=1 Tax=Cinchona calisaya TaxID=153742 RepID=A0ABD2ZHQ0_9GENT
MEVMQKLRTEVERKKEALHHFKADVEEVVEEAASLLRRRHTSVSAADVGGDSNTSIIACTGYVAVDLDAYKMEGGINVEADEKEKSEQDSIYFEKSEGMWKCRHCIWTYQTGNPWIHHIHQKHYTYPSRGNGLDFNVKVEDLGAKLNDVDIHQVLSAVINGKEVENLKDKLLPTSTKPLLQEETDRRVQVDDAESEESDEEVIELEFERAAERMHTHDGYNMYCPNCNNRITKVVLRRKIRPRTVEIPSVTRRDDLFGCSACFSIFLALGNRLKQLLIFGKKPDTSIPKGPNDILSQHGGGDVRIPVDERPGETKIPKLSPIPIVPPADAIPPVTTTASQSSVSVEIVKSFVYGGLMESITSLSVVSSAAASEATTLNIVALGLANLVGGLIVLAHNLKDLRYGDSSETNESRYKEQLGGKEHFPLHATIAVLSYLVFGIIPPVIYGFTFRESNDRDYKLLAVAAASLLCIVILAIAKAYVRGEHKFMEYFKTILYYVTSAVMASGIAYAVGDLANKLLEKLGWLNPPTVKPQMFSQAKSFNPTSWASY